MDDATMKELGQAVVTAMTLGQRQTLLDADGEAHLRAALDQIAQHGGRRVIEAVLAWQAGGMLRRDPRPVRMVDTTVQKEAATRGRL